MRFSPQFLDELRARLPVSEVVGQRVKLRKAGREWKGLSPFNKEKTPSFFVNDQKAMWFDFSSGKNGNIFDFVMATEGVSFPEAVERLAGQAGVPLPVMTREAQAHEERRKTLHDIVELAAKFFEANLASRAGARGRGYLADRGISPATQLKFRLGYASGEQYALKEHLGAAKIPVEDMVEAGLLVAGEDIPVPYDRFRDRVMFPISRLARTGHRLRRPRARQGSVGEISRIRRRRRSSTRARRSTTSPRRARPRTKARRVIAVEGYVDVIAMVTAGFEATVAPLGTALTAEQLALMWRMADEPMLCFDGDDAGRRAAYRAIDVALPLVKPGKSLKFAALPDGQDPDDLVRSGGREAVEDVLGAARPLADMLWARESEAGPFAYARAPRRARSAAARGDGDHRRRNRAPLLPAGFRRAASARCSRRSRSMRAAAAELRRAGARRAQRPRSRRRGAAPRLSPRIGFGRDGHLCGGKPAARGEPAASRPSRRHSAARGADPAGGAQSSLAAARPPGGTGRNRVPPRRCAKAQSRADRRSCASFGEEPGLPAAESSQAGEAAPNSLRNSPAAASPTFSRGSSARSPRPRSGARGRKPVPAMFCRPGSSFLPCIGNGIP